MNIFESGIINYVQISLKAFSFSYFDPPLNEKHVTYCIIYCHCPRRSRHRKNILLVPQSHHSYDRILLQNHLSPRHMDLHLKQYYFKMNWMQLKKTRSVPWLYPKMIKKIAEKIENSKLRLDGLPGRFWLKIERRTRCIHPFSPKPTGNTSI